MAQRTDVLIIGGGQAGLAMSRCLSQRKIDHVVLERGEIGQRWIDRRPSLRLLTPAWMSRLPGFRYSGADPDAFLRRDDVVALLRTYAQDSGCPVECGVTVERASRAPGGFQVSTDRGIWHARALVVAVGACHRAKVPRFASRLDRRVRQIAADGYDGEASLGAGGVLVVGGSASGLQIAEEIARTGRPVTLAVGGHVRLPRRYRGHDILFWLDACGLLTEPRRFDPAVGSAEAQPSMQLVGSDSPRNIDLGTLADAGVRVVGRAADALGTRLAIGETLRRDVRSAEERLTRLLGRIDAHISGSGLDAPADRLPAPVPVSDQPREIDLEAEGIGTIVWATGYGRDYRWLDVPVLRPDGEIAQTGGVTATPGLFTLGLPFMRRRNSTFIDGVGLDAEDIAAAVSRHLAPALARAA